MNLLHDIKRMIDMKYLRHKFLQHCDKKYKIKVTNNFISKLKNKKILMMHASPFNYQMLQQRPHHFLRFWAKHFDYVLYWSIIIDEPVKYKDNIYLVPCTPIDKFKNVDIYFYMSSVSCVDYKDFFKMKQLGYKIIYDYYDELSDAIANPQKAQKAHENLSKINPQIILTTSQRLYDNMKTIFPQKEIYLVKNGVTVEDFAKPASEIPTDMIDIVQEKKPIVGYYGYLANWIDLELIEKCLKERPDYNFIFIGKPHSGYKYQNLLEYSNFHYLGHKNYEELYKYSTNFDCAILPFKLGNIAKATSPNKLFEFMAIGVPSVCTADMVECRGFDGVLVSNDNDDFVKNIDKAISMSKDKNIVSKLKQTALANTWESKANQIYKIIETLD